MISHLREPMNRKRLFTMAYIGHGSPDAPGSRRYGCRKSVDDAPKTASESQLEPFAPIKKPCK